MPVLNCKARSRRLSPRPGARRGGGSPWSAGPAPACGLGYVMQTFSCLPVATWECAGRPVQYCVDDVLVVVQTKLDLRSPHGQEEFVRDFRKQLVFRLPGYLHMDMPVRCRDGHNARVMETIMADIRSRISAGTETI